MNAKRGTRKYKRKSVVGKKSVQSVQSVQEKSAVQQIDSTTTPFPSSERRGGLD